MLIVIAGVSCAGKTTVGQSLARQVDNALFLDADDFHSPQAKAQMASGIGLRQEQRDDWLGRVEDAVRAAAASPDATSCTRRKHLVLACSALTLRLRTRLRSFARSISLGFVLVWLQLAQETAAARLAARPGHWAAHPDFLRDQFLVAEPPQAAERAKEGDTIVLPADAGADETIILAEVARRAPHER
mmetsp:Transcript_16308/g.51036  ORF Transcript_16308/g.51036 Transcript_16308/m.51036 type:complete len:188 (-) Transcript_16308:182-745(-)